MYTEKAKQILQSLKLKLKAQNNEAINTKDLLQELLGCYDKLDEDSQYSLTLYLGIERGY